MKFGGEFMLFETAECKLGCEALQLSVVCWGVSCCLQMCQCFIQYFTKMHTLNQFSEFLKSKWQLSTKKALLEISRLYEVSCLYLFHE